MGLIALLVSVVQRDRLAGRFRINQYYNKALASALYCTALSTIVIISIKMFDRFQIIIFPYWIGNSIDGKEGVRKIQKKLMAVTKNKIPV